MFGFEKLEVYNLTHRQYLRVNEVANTIPVTPLNQDAVNALRLMSMEMLQMLIQGASHIEPNEKRKYYTKSRTAVFQSVALIKIIKGFDDTAISEADFTELYDVFEDLSRMMLSLLKSKGGSSANRRRRERDDKPSKADDAMSLESNNTSMATSSWDTETKDKEDDFKDFNSLNIGE